MYLEIDVRVNGSVCKISPREFAEWAEDNPRVMRCEGVNSFTVWYVRWRWNLWAEKEG